MIFIRRSLNSKFISGMGISLSHVKRILDSCKEETSIEDRFKGDHNKGSNFIIFIPK